MIAALTGIVVETRVPYLTLMVGGVGYRVAVRDVNAFSRGSEVTLHTHLAVRENALDLYGFLTLEELSMFEALIELPKIGPKSALQIMTQADLETLLRAINEKNPEYLTKMSGIGRKTAEKIVHELYEKVGGAAGGTSPIHGGDSDVVDALVALGYSEKDARGAVLALPEDITHTNDRIKAALRLMSRG